MDNQELTQEQPQEAKAPEVQFVPPGNASPEPAPKPVQQEEQEPVDSSPEKEVIEQEVAEDNIETQDIETTEEAPVEESSDQEFVSEIVEDNVEAPKETTSPEPVSENNVKEYSEGIQKLAEFMEETGGSMEDFLNLNKDLNSMDDLDVVKEYYKKKYPHMSDERINRKMNKSFLFDEDLDNEDDIQDKKDLFEDELHDARKYLSEQKDRYYADIKTNKNNDLPEEAIVALEYQQKHQASQENAQKALEDFDNKSKSYFSSDFKGFDYKIGEGQSMWVKTPNLDTTKSKHSNPNAFVEEFFDETGAVKDVSKYNKALFAALNADRLAKHFYNEGRTAAIKERAAASKNVDLTPNINTGGVPKQGATLQFVLPQKR